MGRQAVLVLSSFYSTNDPQGLHADTGKQVDTPFKYELMAVIDVVV